MSAQPASPRARPLRVWIAGGFCVLAITVSLVIYLVNLPGREDFSAVGGTILLYELEDKQPFDEALFTKAIQNRLDEAELSHAHVRVAGPAQVEILVPRRQDHDKDLEDVKALVARQGKLEFRVLANSVDDHWGQEMALGEITLANDLVLRAEKGLPPRGPMKEDDASEPAHFTLNLPRGQNSVVSYSWVELGPQECRALNLDNTARDFHIKQVKLNQAFKLNEAAGRPVLSGALFFARKCTGGNLPDKERRRKDTEYFVLARDPEFDPADPTEKVRVPMIDGSYLASAVTSPAADLRPAVLFTFNAEGGNLLGDLTRKNVPSGNADEVRGTRRHLAIILDGLVMTAPPSTRKLGPRAKSQGPSRKRNC
jgi:preprotein translocase subunit SecD